MIDLLFSFPFESDAAAALQPLGLWHPATDDSPASWDTSRLLPGVRVTMADLTVATGWWCVLSADKPDPRLVAIAHVVLDEAKPEEIAGLADISPFWSGRAYALPGLPPAPEDDLPAE